ncbi:hypothetical protein BpHYR1_029916 [Brachionus plicatilis]|uniref:Uncharacterized protein n=1 Tax=Brachionus plicatilis TaxID=10195 RepID=A0A3M7SVV5_BRAPC|nr:hypothetical protein BpHYR1_029916 [Brachionus plicatilis]
MVRFFITPSALSLHLDHFTHLALKPSVSKRLLFVIHKGNGKFKHAECGAWPERPLAMPNRYTSPSSFHSSKNLEITLSTLKPVLALIRSTCFIWSPLRPFLTHWYERLFIIECSNLGPVFGNKSNLLPNTMMSTEAFSFINLDQPS